MFKKHGVFLIVYIVTQFYLPIGTKLSEFLYNFWGIIVKKIMKNSNSPKLSAIVTTFYLFM